MSARRDEVVCAMIHPDLVRIEVAIRAPSHDRTARYHKDKFNNIDKRKVMPVMYVCTYVYITILQEPRRANTDAMHVQTRYRAEK